MNRRLLSSVVSTIVLVAMAGCAGMGDKKSTDTPAADQAPKVATAKSVVDRYMSLNYGKDGVRNDPSTTMKGPLSIEQFNIEGPFTIHSRAPDSNASNIELMGATLSNALRSR